MNTQEVATGCGRVSGFMARLARKARPLKYPWIPAGSGMTGGISAAYSRSRVPPGLPTPLNGRVSNPPLRCRCLAALVPHSAFRGGTASAGSLAHVGVSEVKIGDDAVARFEAEEVAHVLVVGDGARTPDTGQAEGVGRQLHVLDGRGAGSVVLARFDLVAAGNGDHGYHDGRPEGLLAFAADPAGHHIFVLPLGLGQESRCLRPGPRQFTASFARKDVETPGFGNLVVGSVHSALQNSLDEVPRHGVLLYAVHALARLYGTDHIQKWLPANLIYPRDSSRTRHGKLGRIHISF